MEREPTDPEEVAVDAEIPVEADLRVQVPRNANGSLEDGVTGILRGVDDVVAVREVDVTGLLPRLNDLQVDATVALTIAVGDEPPEIGARYALTDGFGVADVVDVRVDRTETAPNRPVIEYG